jgi:hypothetical protein
LFFLLLFASLAALTAECNLIQLTVTVTTIAAAAAAPVAAAAAANTSKPATTASFFTIAVTTEAVAAAALVVVAAAAASAAPTTTTTASSSLSHCAGLAAVDDEPVRVPRRLLLRLIHRVGHGVRVLLLVLVPLTFTVPT